MTSPTNNNISPIIPNSRKDSSSSVDNKTRPTGLPSANRDFKRIMGRADQNKNSGKDSGRDSVKDKDEDEEEYAVDGIGGVENEDEVSDTLSAPRKAPLSLFDQKKEGEIADTPRKNAVSLFDLSSGNSPDRPVARQIQMPSPFGAQFAAAATAGSHEKGDVDSAIEMGKASSSVSSTGSGIDTVDENERAAAETPSEAYVRLTSKKDFSKGDFDTGSSSSQSEGKEKSITTRFATEQPDLSSVNPIPVNNQPIAAANINFDKTAPPTSSINLHELISQLVDKATQLDLNGKTETTITLKQPPLLAGANLVVTGFDSAKGEFNISFDSLTQAAKNVLDLQVNRDSLLNALNQKGYAVHIISTTTTIENHLSVEASPRDDRGQRGDENEDQQRRRRNQQQG